MDFCQQLLPYAPSEGDKPPQIPPIASLTHDVTVHRDLSLWLLLYANSTIIAKQFWVHKYMVKMFAHLFWTGMTSVIAHDLIPVAALEENVLSPATWTQRTTTEKGWPSYILRAVVDEKY